jgi:hypothetical protein
VYFFGLEGDIFSGEGSVSLRREKVKGGNNDTVFRREASRRWTARIEGREKKGEIHTTIQIQKQQTSIIANTTGQWNGIA